jgi:hypothetical protein
MSHRSQLADSLTAGLWLIGLGVLFATHFWWPGILFLIGFSVILLGWVRGLPWYSVQGGIWAILIGIWALVNFRLPYLFVALGIWVILVALLRPDPFRKPFVDNTLE